MTEQAITPAQVRQPYQLIKPLRVRKTETCKLLGLSRNGLHLLQQRDPTFPKELKEGPTRQAPSYFVLAEVEAWMASQIAKRDGLA